jgi:hypothetical protein
MFQFPRFPSARRRMVRHCLRTGLPHSGIPGLAGTTAYRGFSQPCRALHRPPMPRHPPRALNILTDPSLLSQGVLEGALCSFVKVLLGGTATRAVVSHKTVGLMPTALCASALVYCLFSCCQGLANFPKPLFWPATLAGGAGGIRTPDLRRAKAALSQLSYGPSQRPTLVGHPGFEPGTSVLSGPRSNQLS